jgi:hypothetical protein
MPTSFDETAGGVALLEYLKNKLPPRAAFTKPFVREVMPDFVARWTAAGLDDVTTGSLEPNAVCKRCSPRFNSATPNWKQLFARARDVYVPRQFPLELPPGMSLLQYITGRAASKLELVW